MKQIIGKPEVESAMIATLLHHPELLKTLALKEEHFSVHRLALAFKTLLDMQEKKEFIDIVTFGGRFFDAGGRASEIDALFRGEEWFSPVHAEGLLIQLAEETAKRKILEAYNSLQDAPLQFIAEVKKLEMDFIEQKVFTIGQLMAEYKAEYQSEKDRITQRGSTGLITGFSKIDEKAPFESGNLVILAAKTSVGKTALALNIAINAAMYKQQVLFFSAEMTNSEIRNRILSQLTGISSTKFKYRDVDSSLARVTHEVDQIASSFHLVEAGNLTSFDIARIANQKAQTQKIDLVVVDYIQYLKDRTEKGQNNNDRIGQITRNLKGLGIELDCPVLALSQVNRATAGVPELQNLRDSGNIEQDADIVLIVHREDKEDTTAAFVIAKNRNGQVGRSELKFNPSLTKFYE